MIITQSSHFELMREFFTKKSDMGGDLSRDVVTLGFYQAYYYDYEGFEDKKLNDQFFAESMDLINCLKFDVRLD